MSERRTAWERVAPHLVAGTIRALRRTVRMRVLHREPVERFAADGQRYILTFWHAHLMLMIYAYVGTKLTALISRHRDGELIARSMELFDVQAARGSSTTGGSAAFREMLRAVRGGSDLAITPDGPRGPARRVKPGVIAAARALDLPIVPAAVGARALWRARSWDGFRIPKPFTRVVITYGEPLRVSHDAPVEAEAARLEAVLNALEAAADRAAADRTAGKRP